jgi:hypothetical protein
VDTEVGFTGVQGKVAEKAINFRSGDNKQETAAIGSKASSI